MLNKNQYLIGIKENKIGYLMTHSCVSFLGVKYIKLSFYLYFCANRKPIDLKEEKHVC